MKEKNIIDEILRERGDNYGSYRSFCKLENELLDYIINNTNYNSLEPEYKTTIRMVINKLSRGLNGKIEYLDNWTDIIGYVTLLKNILEEDRSKIYLTENNTDVIL